MADSPITDDVGVLSYEVTSEGQKIKDAYQVKSIRVVKDINKIPTATLILFDGNPSDQKFTISDSEDLIPGKEVEIKAGYKSTTESIFKGIVVKHGISISDHGAPQLELEIKDKAIKMTVGRKNAYYKEKKDSDIISSLISGAGLTADSEATTVEHPMLVQHYSSDWDFMMTRADINGKIVIVDDGKVTVAKPKASESAVLTVTYGTDLLSFNGEMNAKTQLSNTTSTAWDMSNQAIVQNTGANPSVNSQGNITSSKLADVLSISDYGLQSTGGIDSDSLKVWSDAQLLKSWMNKITGTASFQGSAKAIPGCIIEFKGVGDRFNGSAFISGVEHNITDGDWVTKVKMGLSDEWYSETPDIVAPITSGLVPGINGLMIGKVKQLDSDPDNEFRILVTIPMMQDDSNGVWARLSNFYATDSAGIFFVPEVGDEVILGFMNDDPRFPIILGSVYSSKLAPAETPDEENTIKSILTKSKLLLKFDDEKKRITVATPAGNTMMFNDDESNITITDQNDNKIEMNSSGISMDSPGSITIKATQEVSIQAATVSIKGDQSVDASGGSMSISGEMSTSIKGGAECSVASDGNLTAKGLMVMIN